MSEIERLEQEGLLERIPPDTDRATDWIEAARRHLDAARTIIATDPAGAHLLAYDAARKAITAHMAAAGLRTRSVPGAHWAVARYATSLGSAHALRDLDVLRRARNASEYAGKAVGVPQAEHAIDAADEVLALVRDLMGL